MKLTKEELSLIIKEEFENVLKEELQQEGIFDYLKRSDEENSILKIASKILAQPEQYSIQKTFDMKNYLTKYNKFTGKERSRMSFSRGSSLSDTIKDQLAKMADKSQGITYEGLKKDIFILSELGQLSGMSGDRDFERVMVSKPPENRGKPSDYSISKSSALKKIKPDMVRNIDNLIKKIDRFEYEVLLRNIKDYEKLSKGALNSLENRLATFRAIDIKDSLETIKKELETIKQKTMSIKRLNEQDVE